MEETMMRLTMNRRTVLAGLALSTAVGLTPALAQSTAPYEVTPALIEAAKKEGTVTFYTATDVAVAERVGKAFEEKYPGVKVKVERSGSERVFQRISQEYGSNIHNADVIETSDAVHFLLFKRNGWLAQAVPAEVAKNWPADAKDADGYYAAYRAHLSVIGYNTQQVKAEDAPKSHADLLNPKWRGRIVKAHPGYSGTVMTGTDALSRALGWEYFEKLGKQRIMQVQSSTEPPKKLAQGERSIQADGNEYNMFQLKESGVPVEVVYAAEGTPVAIGHAGLLKNAPHPNAAKLFYSFIFDKDTQQLNSDVGGLRSYHPGVKEKESRTPLSKIKLLYSDPVKLEPEIESIKKKYEEYFGT
jgi:iron(III) transport system substrate-binding protein